ncbi:MAG: MFS transporter [Pseudomonadales bacterium]|nr:MFS transporter [Pseudomonadales bacterium]
MTGMQNIDVGELIDARPLGSMQWRILALCSLVVFLDGYDIQVMALAVPSLVQEWSLPAASFSLALAAALIGLGLGAAFLAPLGDRYGRRSALVFAVAVVGLATVATGFSGSIEELFVWRFITGLGLGASVPNAVAMTSEYMPLRRRAALTALMYCNIALGAFVAGFLAPPLIRHFGWQATFMAGGIAPLILCLLLIFGAAESLVYLLSTRPGDPRIKRILQSLAPDLDPNQVTLTQTAETGGSGVPALFSPLLRSRTLLLWAIFSINFFVLYYLISWLPTLLSNEGWPQARALQGAVMIQAGGVVGGLFLAWLADRGYVASTLVIAFLVTLLALALFAFVPSTPLNWGMLLLVVGGGISGTQLLLIALAAMFYPPPLRASGVGWAVAIARFGAILGPLVGGWIITLDLETFQVLGLLALPVMLNMACAMLVPRVWPGARG